MSLRFVFISQPVRPEGARTFPWKILVPIATIVVAFVAVGLYWRSHKAVKLTDKDTIVLADFKNTTGDPVFDEALKTALTVALNQSPFLNVLPESKVIETIKLMARPPAYSSYFDDHSVYGNLANVMLALQKFDEARQLVQQAQTRKIEDLVTHSAQYALGFLSSDARAMSEQQRWYASQPYYESFGLSLAADTEAYSGHSRKACELSKQSVKSALQANNRELGAIWNSNLALREAHLAIPLSREKRRQPH